MRLSEECFQILQNFIEFFLKDYFVNKEINIISETEMNLCQITKVE